MSHFPAAILIQVFFMNKSYLLLAVLAAAVLTLSGCTNVATFDYRSAYGPMLNFQPEVPPTKTIAVAPFHDYRGLMEAEAAKFGITTSHPAGDHGSFYLGLIPLFPFGYVEKEEPEKSVDFVSLGRFHFDLAQDLANASELSLKNSNLFKSVERTNKLENAKTDYIWRGRVISSCYRGYMYSYCITYFLSPVLWVLGAPSGTSVNDLAVRFELADTRSGRVLWSYTFTGSDSITHWIYARTGKDTSMYAKLMKQAMNAALLDLSAKLPAIK